MNVSTSARKLLLVFFVSFSVMAFAAANSLWAQTQQPAASEQKPAEKPADAKPKLVGNNLGLPAKLGEQIAKVPEGKGKGQIDPAAPRGAFGVPGAPQVGMVLAFLWATWVGWIFSTVGAFGGRRDIMEKIAPLGSVYQAGTLSGNPVALAAGMATLRALLEPGVFEGVAAAAIRLGGVLERKDAERAAEVYERALSAAPGRRELVKRVLALRPAEAATRESATDGERKRNHLSGNHGRRADQQALAAALELKARLGGAPVPAPETLALAFPELAPWIRPQGQQRLF